MKSFLKYTLASLLALIIGAILLFVIFMVLVVASSMDAPADIKDDSVLLIRFKKEIVDRAPKSPIANVGGFPLLPDPKMGLNDIIKSIEEAKTDKKIRGIVIAPDIIRTGIASKEEIRNALIDFKESGKFIISYADYFSQSTYYVISPADRIYLNPAGYMDFKGLSAEILFFKKAFDKWGIEAQVFRHGEYKGAVEPLILDKMSDENRSQIRSWLNSIWRHYLVGVSNERSISIDELNTIADSIKIRTPHDAVTFKFVDDLRYKDELLEELKDSIGVKNIEDMNFISLSDYIRHMGSTKEKSGKKNKIAVIYARGSIVMGEQGENSIGSESISREIRKARMDSTIKAIVFRVNSGGGLGLASDIILREIKLAAETKPVIASMGDYAASGGYYILAAADTIVANPNTITGSIGVFGILLNTSRLFEEKVGITYDYVLTNPHANMESTFDLLDNEEKKYFQEVIDSFYYDFITHISKGRNMTIEEVDKIANGRVWSGKEAHDIGLVDVLGGLYTAIDIAVEKAGLENYQIVSLPSQDDPFTQFIKQFTEEVKMGVLKRELGDIYQDLQIFKELKNMEGIQARIPYQIRVY